MLIAMIATSLVGILAAALDVDFSPESSIGIVHGSRPRRPPALPPPPAVELSAEQKASFVREGVLVLRNVVPVELVDDALPTINAALGAGSAACVLSRVAARTACCGAEAALLGQGQRRGAHACV